MKTHAQQGNEPESENQEKQIPKRRVWKIQIHSVKKTQIEFKAPSKRFKPAQNQGYNFMKNPSERLTAHSERSQGYSA
ncbi:MAG TPA: hypothetical protein DCO72_10290 [Ruminococcus sp.]|nr:hypothetical protein [Ruminococcus sp.]